MFKTIFDLKAATPLSRRRLLGRAALTGLAAAPVLGLIGQDTEAAPFAAQTLTASNREAFRDIFTHEQNHVQQFETILQPGVRRPKPTFKNLEAATFQQFADMNRVFAQVASGAYTAGLPDLANRNNRALAGTFALIEARHAGFLDVFNGYDVTTQAATNSPTTVEKPLTQAQVRAAASPYIASLNDNGKFPFAYTPGRDTEIFNFALVLEYLELTFLQINVPKFVGTN